MSLLSRYEIRRIGFTSATRSCIIFFTAYVDNDDAARRCAPELYYLKHKNQLRPSHGPSRSPLPRRWHTEATPAPQYPIVVINSITY